MDLQANDILPVAILAGVIYLIKIGALSAIVAALVKLWKKLTGRKKE